MRARTSCILSSAVSLECGTVPGRRKMKEKKKRREKERKQGREGGRARARVRKKGRKINPKQVRVNRNIYINSYLKCKWIECYNQKT